MKATMRVMGESWTNPYTNAQYQYEKIIGRRKATGEKKLVRLKAVHRKMIEMHLKGLSNRDIAFVTGFDEMAVSRVLRDPLAQAYITHYLEGQEIELLGLTDMATQALRSGLCSADERVQMTAVDKFFKATGRYAKAEKEQETAEDVIARALMAIQDQSQAIKALAKGGNGARVLNMLPAKPEQETELIEDGSESNSSK